MMKGVNERIDAGVLQWFGHMERIEKDRITKRIYIRVCMTVILWVGCRRDGLIL